MTRLPRGPPVQCGHRRYFTDNIQLGAVGRVIGEITPPSSISPLFSLAGAMGRLE